MDFYEKFIEFDYNPFILFNKNGKIISLNQEAQYLLGSVAPNELYQLALSYASENYGFKTTFLNLDYGKFRFFAICVGYENDEEIALRLYRYPELKIETIEDSDTDLVNIYAILDLCISSNATKFSANFTKDIDPTLPEVKLNTKSFIKVLNQIFESFKNSSKIKIKLYIKIGEYIKLKNKKYTLFAIELSGDRLNSADLEKIKDSAKSINSFIESGKKKIILNIPMITV